MPTVAEQLRQGREAARLSIAQVADITKMRADHVQALEAGRYDVFTAPVYIRGFVRTYVRVLKLDEPAVVACLDQELAKTEKFREHPSLMGAQRGLLDTLMLQLSRIPWRLVLPIVALLVVIGAAFAVSHWVNQRRLRDPLEDIPPARYQPAPTPAGDTLPLPSPPRR